MKHVIETGKAGFVAAILMFAVPAAVSAATATSTLTVTATVLSSCTVAPATLAFGNYDPSLATATTGSTSIIVTCTGAASGSVGLDKGTNGTSVTARAMKLTAGTDTLNYQLFQPSGGAASTTNWGNTPTTDTVAFSATLLVPGTLTVYGSIPAGQAPTAGAYTDTVNITVTY
ncbi:MAG: SCPU domain-containing protein [Nevskiaceae bacterium]|nr:MAG: SCPU domain-containing protein [Nevskiaceae bacterium]TBR74802.1 MAG: SCPU domain-containing protein [Nevskiaceae bacterium]